MTAYNGHKSWNQWNVSLWINNDEYWYFRSVDLCQQYSRNKAVNILMTELPDKTPDGAIYNRTSVKNALVDII